MMIVISVILYASTYLFDFSKIIKEKNKKISLIYGVLFALSFIVLILHETGFAIPSPAKPLKYLIATVLNLK